MSKQLVRQLDMLRELQAARYGKTVHELAKEPGVTKRTVQRDLGVLREAGFILSEERRDQRVYYKLDKETGLPLNFPVLEVAAMIFAERAGLGLVGTPFGEHLRSGVRRLTAAMAPEMRQFLERAADAYVPLARGHKPYEDTRDILENLNEAMLSRRVCRVSYRSPGAEEPRQYEIEPLRFLPHRGGLYVISRVPWYDNLITQAVERFDDVKVTEQEFEPPDHLPIDERVRDAFGVSYEEPMDAGGPLRRGPGALRARAHLAPEPAVGGAARRAGGAAPAGRRVLRDQELGPGLRSRRRGAGAGGAARGGPGGDAGGAGATGGGCDVICRLAGAAATWGRQP